MIPQPVRVTDPAAALDLEAVAYADLLAALQREQAALVAADVEAVRAAVVDKSTRVDALRRLTQQRESALRAAGFASGPAGMTAWLARNGSAARDRWSTITRLAAEASAQNALNGKLILTQQRHWDRALSALLRAAGMNATYGADGRTQHAVSGRAIVTT